MQPIVKAALSTAGPRSVSNTSATHSEIPMLLGSFPCCSAGPLENRDLQSPSHSTYICTHMQMEKMDFSAQRQPEFWQVLRASSSLKKLFPKRINWSLKNYNDPFALGHRQGSAVLSREASLYYLT